MRRVLWLLLPLLALIHFEYNAEGWNLYYRGTGTAIFALIILGAGLCIKIFNSVQDLYIAKGIIDKRISTPYDLLPFIIIFPFAIGFRFFGDLLQGPVGIPGYRWLFEWGESDYKWLIFLGILAVLFVYRINVLIRKVQEHYKHSNMRQEKITGPARP
jgi:hypothetical protein